MLAVHRGSLLPYVVVVVFVNYTIVWTVLRFLMTISIIHCRIRYCQMKLKKWVCKVLGLNHTAFVSGYQYSSQFLFFSKQTHLSTASMPSFPISYLLFYTLLHRLYEIFFKNRSKVFNISLLSYPTTIRWKEDVPLQF